MSWSKPKRGLLGATPLLSISELLIVTTMPPGGLALSGPPGEDAVFVVVDVAVLDVERAVAGFEQDAGAVGAALVGRIGCVVLGAGDVEADQRQAGVGLEGHVDDGAAVRCGLDR